MTRRMHIKTIVKTGSRELPGRLIARIAILFAVLSASTATGGELGVIPKEIQAKLKAYESKYYTIYSDLPEETVREAIMRLNTAAEEYAVRTKGFAGALQSKAPVYLFSSYADYKSAVGDKYANTGGLCHSRGRTVTLYVRADKAAGAGAWKTMRHEGFHQFVRLVIGGQIPVWVNEGLAEYFETSVWTGDALL
ncbi:MAG: hypothetical protein HZA50_05935 [Planctomycetes bacterium]|nr:hypothetical protein [Planctomycetota bacterium]